MKLTMGWGALFRVASLLTLCVAAVETRGGTHDVALQAVQDGTATRSAAMLQAYYNKPSPALDGVVTSNPIGIAGYALTALWKNQDTTHANQLIVDLNADYETPDDPAVFDWPAYWSMSQLIRTWYLFNAQADAYPGRLSAPADAAIKAMFWHMLDQRSLVADANPADTFYLQGSDNHDMMRKSYFYLGCQMLLSDPAYATLTLHDGHTVAEHYAAWKVYFKEYFKQRAQKGLSVEIASPTYAKYILQSVYNLRDFADSDQIRTLAGKYLDLWWADFANESVDSLRGGAKTRSYKSSASWSGIAESMYPFAYLYFAVPTSIGSTHPAALNAATSTYRVPLTIMDLALYPEAKGDYTYISRRPGEGTPPSAPPALDPIDAYGFNLPHPVFPAYLRRSTFVTPNYIVGAFTVDPTRHYTAVNTQNRWMGAIFRGDPTAPLASRNANSRVFAVPAGTAQGGQTSYKDLDGVGSGSALLVQKLPGGTNTRGMATYFSSDFQVVEDSGWVFGRNDAGTGYVGIRPASGGYSWPDEYVTVTPTGDAYVENGANAGVSYATATALTVKRRTDLNSGCRLAYVKFPLNTVPGHQTSDARLRLYCASKSDGTFTHQVYGLQDASWTANSAFTWNAGSPNHATTSYAVTGVGTTATLVATITLTTAAQYYDCDVTAAVDAALRAGSSEVAFLIYATDGDGANVNYSSMEDSSHRPALVIHAPSRQYTASQDSYIKNGSGQTGLNHGTESTLGVYDDTPAHAAGQMSYLKFDLSDYAYANVINAKVRLYVASKASGTTVHDLYGLTDTTWAESAITWATGSPNHAPTGYAVTGTGSTAILASSCTIDASGQWYEFDATEFVNQQLAAGTKVMSFLVAAQEGDNLQVSYNSREAAANQPILVVKEAMRQFTATEDTFVDKNTPTTAYGSTTGIQARNGTTTTGGVTTENFNFAYVKFDVRNFPGDGTINARLKLYVTAFSGATTQMVYGLTTDSWSESTTWADGLNHDASAYTVTGGDTGTAVPIGTIAVNQTGEYQLSVSSFVASRLRAGKFVSFLIAAASADNKNVIYGSSESSHKPSLEIMPQTWVNNNDELSPVVIQVGRPADYANLTAFATAVKGQTFRWNSANEFEYQALGADGSLKIYLDSTLPKINGTTVELNPAKTYDSPFISATYDSPVVTVKNTDLESMTLDFNYGSDTKTFAAVADTYVYNGSPATSYGTLTELGVKNSTTTGRIAYLKFDLTKLKDPTVTTATLKLYATAMTTGTTTQQVYGLTDNTWAESATWASGSPNHDPGAGSYTLTGIGSTAVLLDEHVIAAAGQEYDYDLTAFINSQLAAGVKSISVMLVGKTADGINVNYATREASSHQPQLSLELP